MVAVRIPTIGEILLSLSTLIYQDGFWYISGHDDERNDYMIQCSYMSFQDDFSAHYGWANIVGYWTNSDFIPCKCYSSIG